jgi:hypothetical protein
MKRELSQKPYKRKQKQIVILLGAGATIPWGGPSNNDIVQKLISDFLLLMLFCRGKLGENEVYALFGRFDYNKAMVLANCPVRDKMLVATHINPTPHPCRQVRNIVSNKLNINN